MSESKNMSRRSFLGGAALLTGAAMVSPSLISCASATNSKKAGFTGLVTPDGKPNSKFAGVQIGNITNSFRNINTMDDFIKACIAANVSSIELRSMGQFETLIGGPANPSSAQARPMYEVVNQGRGAGGGRPQYTPDQLAAIERYPGELLNAGGGRPEQTPEQLAAIEKYNKDLADFRKSNAAIDGWATFGKKLNEAGIDVHLFKFEAGQTDELLDYSFAACKAVGALGITTEASEQKCASFGKVAERNGSLAVYHNHGQYANITIAEIEKWLDMSPANRLNFDCVHYFGFGYDKGPILSPTEFIEHFHDRIISIHIKDKTSSTNPVTPNTNQVWGQGETPLKEILTFVRDKYPQIYCDVELEYMVSQWSTPEAEIKKCVEYARQILLLD